MQIDKALTPGVITGDTQAPPSKSITHRACIIAALAGTTCKVLRPLQSDDTQRTLEGLRALGYVWEREGDTLRFAGRHTLTAPATVNAGESGTTARFLTAVAALSTQSVVMRGTGRMHDRPMAPLIDALEQLGAVIDSAEGRRLPLRIVRGVRDGGECSVHCEQSSQFLSALLMIAPLLNNGLRITAGGSIISQPYVDLTVEMMRRAGVEVTRDGGEFVVAPGSAYDPVDLTVEGDYSNAAYLIAAATLTGGDLKLSGLYNDSMQGDRRILDIVCDCGAEVQWSPHNVGVRGTRRIRSFDIDLGDCPDLAPTVAALALFAEGPSTLRNLGHLRHKESDRLEALVTNIRRLGLEADAGADTLTIRPGEMQGTRIDSFGDHRIAMSFALVGLRIPGISISDPDCVQKSYPEFWSDLERLRQPNE